MGISIADDELTKEEAFAALVFYMSEAERHRLTQIRIEQCVAKVWNKYHFDRGEIFRARELSKKYATFDEYATG
jgi:hypothetical protein